MQRAIELVHGGQRGRVGHVEGVGQGAQVGAVGAVIVDEELVEQAGVRGMGGMGVGRRVCLQRRRVLLRQALARQVQVLARHLGQRLEGRQLLRGRKRQAQLRGALQVGVAVAVGARAGRRRQVVGQGQLVELQQRALAVAEGQRRAFLDQVGGEAVDAALGELLAARLARVLVAVARILELGAALKVLENQLVGPATHSRR